MESAATVPLQLTQDRARIFRISHVDNLAWVLGNGLHALNGRRDSNFKNIGNLDLIDKRTNRSVPLPPGGTLSDYVPFYFTPYSIMMFNIRTGHGNITRVRNEEIMIFVSSLHRIKRLGIPFVFTNSTPIQ